MKQKKNRDMSLMLLRAIDELELFDPGKYFKVPSEDSYMLIKDTDPESEFFFSINDISIISGGKTQYVLSYRPSQADNSNSNELAFTSDQLNDFYGVWKGYVEEYSKRVNTRDPIFEQSKKELYDYFELVDEDANIHSFSFQQQILIDIYLSLFIKTLEAHKENNELSEEKKSAIDDIIEEANELKETQTERTKHQVIDKFADMLTECKKSSFKLFGDVKAETLKYIVRWTLDHSHEIIGKIKGLWPESLNFIDTINNHLLG